MRYLDELGRKAIHLGSSAIPITYMFISRRTAVWILGALVLVAIVIETLRHFIPAVKAWFERRMGNIFRDFESRTLTGASYVVFGAFLAVLLFDKRIAITVLFFVSISDALASLIGIKFGGKLRFFGKSLAGSGAFLISAVIIAMLALPDDPPAALLGALVATIVEALPLRIAGNKLDDNLTVSLSSGLVMTLMSAPG